MPLTSHGFEYCPQFRRRDVMLLPTNVPKQMIFEVKNLPHPQAAHSGFQCIIIIEGATMLVPARVLYNKHIVCDNTTVSSLIIIIFCVLLLFLFSLYYYYY